MYFLKIILPTIVSFRSMQFFGNAIGVYNDFDGHAFLATSSDAQQPNSDIHGNTDKPLTPWESYAFSFPDAVVRGLCYGHLERELVGKGSITCPTTGLTMALLFETARSRAPGPGMYVTLLNRTFGSCFSLHNVFFSYASLPCGQCVS